ncbi:MAG: hypothetical protein JWL77_2345 [Chthonomonadaceae bacterium]|nr:hypothetical protein [Chthonomonadaceae bacterium]
MSAQQLITLIIVAVAAVYLGRNLVASARNFFSNKSEGCPGCGKCAFADKPRTQMPASTRPNIIPLTDIRTLPKK